VSKHWQPDEDRTRWARADGCASPDSAAPSVKIVWPRGATAGLILVATGCLAIAALVYKAAGPRDMIEKNAAVDWNKVDLPASQD